MLRLKFPDGLAGFIIAVSSAYAIPFPSDMKYRSDGIQYPCDISVIIVSYNTAGLLLQCLDSISAQTDVEFETIVVDNASTDCTLDALKDFSARIKLIANKENAGFARANNMGWKISKGRYLFFLNPDTRVHKGAFKAIKDFMEENPEVGLAGTRIVNPDGSPQSSLERKYPGQRHAKDELKGLKGDIAWLLGASIVARRGEIEELGGFDERFFLYGEDLDLCLTVRKRGLIIGYIPDAVVTHVGGQSEKACASAEVWRKKLTAEIIFYRKHYSKKALKAIVRSNLLKASWRLLLLNIGLIFRFNEDAQAKREKYRMVREVFRNA